MIEDEDNIINNSFKSVTYHKKLTFNNSISTFNAIYLNVRSLRNKMDDIEHFVQSFDCVIHIIFVTEIWIKPCENQFYQISGYNAYFSNRNSEGYGGTGLFIRSDIVSSVAHDFCDNNNNFLIVKLIKQNINLVCIYRAPNDRKENFLKFLTTLETILQKNRRNIIMGDFNINILDKEDTFVNDYLNMLYSCGFGVLNKIDSHFPTRISNTVSTLIDHVITDLFNANYEIFIGSTSLSDHQYIFLNFSTNYLHNQQNEKITKRVLNYDKLSVSSFWLKVLNAKSTGELLSLAKNEIQKCTETIVVNQSLTTKKPWANTCLLNLIKERERYFRYLRKSPQDSFLQTQYKKYAKLCKITNNKLKKEYFNKKFANSLTNPKQLWINLKEAIFNKKQVKINNIYIEINGKLEENQKIVAEKLNEYFTSIAEKITSHLTTPTEQVLDYINYELVSNFKLSHTNANEVNTIIKDLPSSAATGKDGIPTRFLKKFSDDLAIVFSRLINLCFEEKIFPDELKIARIVPIFKMGNKLNMNNYRPISVLPAPSKVFERAIHDRLVTHLENNHIISDRQFGFIKSSNTTAACMGLTSFLSENIDKKFHVSCIFIDLTKAFDTVDHHLLLLKLKKIGISNSDIGLFRSYLTNRKQVVMLDESESGALPINKGVPQGSILGPLLFNIFINDITKLNLNGVLQLYADDAAIMYKSTNLKDLLIQMQSDMDMLEVWFDRNLLVLNTNKTKYMLFENHRLSDSERRDLVITFKRDCIQSTRQFTYLGLVIDTKLKWIKHTEKIKSKITPYIFILQKLSKYLPQKSLIMIYNSYILSHLIYLNPVWSGTAEYALNDLFVLQKKALKYILLVPPRFPTALVFQNNFLSLPVINQIELLCMVYKIKNNLIKHNFNLRPVGDSHEYETRRKSHFQIDHFSSKLCDSNILYRGLNRFNVLPSEVKNTKSYLSFKNLITADIKKGYISSLK